MRKLLALGLMVVAITQPGFTCGPGIPPPGLHCEDGDAPMTRGIEIGQLDGDTFTPLNDAQAYPIEFGSQGGQHTFVSVRFFAEDGEDEWLHTFRLEDDMGNEVGSRLYAERTCDGWTVIDNLQVFVESPDLTEATIELDSGPLDAFGEQTVNFRTSGRIHFR